MIINTIAGITQSSHTIGLEKTQLILAILASLSIPAGIGFKIINKFNYLNYLIKSLNDELRNHAASEGHEQLKVGIKRLEDIDKRFDLHLQDYTNRKDTVQMLFNQLNEKIDHRTGRLFNSIRDVEKHLLAHGYYKIRGNDDENAEI